MDIIKCNKCGHYQQMCDEPCHGCKEDFSISNDFTLLEDQATNQKRFKQLGEAEYNNYMKSMDAPLYMICPKCKFRMLQTETTCPRCGIPVRVPQKKPIAEWNDNVQRKTLSVFNNVVFWIFIVPPIALGLLYLVVCLILAFFR